MRAIMALTTPTSMIRPSRVGTAPSCDSGIHMFTLFYGLSADPVHQGHVDLVTAAVTELHDRGYVVAEVLLVPVYRRNPVGQQPKNGLPASYQDRVRMTGLAAGVISERLARTGTLTCAVTISVSLAARELAVRSGGPNYDLD